EVLSLFLKLILLGANLHFLKLGQMTQTQLKDGFGLTIRQAKGSHQGALGLILLADDAYDLINVEVSNQQACKDMQPVHHLAQAMLQTPTHRGTTEIKPFAQHLG